MMALRDLRLPVLRRQTAPVSACRACKLPISPDHLYCDECMERPVQPGYGPVCIDCGNFVACACKKAHR
ncbi:hypothetical protein [Deinococcus sp. QL22]|uniref:hypothetical protein n=1 Tax=Deinococcus sp. QL22 TaxID=2939437 RepID=UPI002016D052|nr:hypothetical protein [Deinococcus sp. QL22]UQN05502.1 hypothetical protein M1R55_11510 [Deinococcus sp. QL22]